MLQNYIENKYGKDQVCYAGAYKQIKIKQGIKDLGRGLLDYGYLNKVTEIRINESRTGKWEELFSLANKDPMFKNFIQNNVELINLLKGILNQPRSKSIHPSAQIIVPEGKTVFQRIPVRIEDGKVIAEFDGSELEKLGYLKNDWLSLSQLDKIKNILDLIQKQDPSKERLNIYDLPVLEDDYTFQLFQDGITEDVFQFGSKGLKQMCKKAKPENLSELADIVSLFRPGPIGAGAHNKYIKLKHGEEEIGFDFGVEDITKPTKGLYIYQEQVMQIVQALGGFTLAEADDVRRAMGKKKAEVLEPYKKQFIEGALERGAKESDAQDIWQKLEYFSGYGFNKSHAVSYSYLGVISQYLKAHYLLPFWITALQKVTEEFLLFRFLSEIKHYHKNISFKGVDINGSKEGFYGDFENNSIYWSLSKVHQVGPAAIEALNSLLKDSTFFSFEEFYKKSKKNGGVNKSVIENLILSGGFDEIGLEDTGYINSPKDRLLIFSKFYEQISRKIIPPPSNSDWWWSLKQKNICGFGEINYSKIFNSSSEYNGKLKSDNKFKSYSPNQILTMESGRVCLGGIITEVREKEDSKGRRYGLININFNDVPIMVYIWNHMWGEVREEIITGTGKILLVKGFIQNSENTSTTLLFTSNPDYRKKEDGEVDILDTHLDHKLDGGVIKRVYVVGDTKEFKDGEYIVVEIKENGEPRWKKNKK